MRREAGVGAVVVALGLAWGLAFAAVESPGIPPKGTEGPDISQRVAPKGTEGPDVRDTLPPMGIEGPSGR
jgi:hypothetical protein